MQIDTPGKALLLGISLFYVGVVLVVPTANVFYQVGSPCIHACCLVLARLDGHSISFALLTRHEMCVCMPVGL